MADRSNAAEKDAALEQSVASLNKSVKRKPPAFLQAREREASVKRAVPSFIRSPVDNSGAKNQSKQEVGRPASMSRNA